MLHPPLHTCSIGPGREFTVLRLDLIHPVTGGNKLFKLKYNLDEALASSHRTILTFGGASSNHLAAVAVACHEAGVKAIGLLRGGERRTPTTVLAESMGMRLEFISRGEYARKNDPTFLKQLSSKYGEFVLVPEGGANEAGIRGCMEILDGISSFDYILCACGTGATYAGLAMSKPMGAVVVGISVLRGENILPAAVEKMAAETGQRLEVCGDDALEEAIIRRDCILSAFAFSGYAAFDEDLVLFKTQFERETGITLDYVYTCKLMYAATKLIENGNIPGTARVLVIHSGGLQGNRAFEERYRRRLGQLRLSGEAT